MARCHDFFVSLVAILCFACVTQGWFLTRLTIAERVLLLIVVVALFRPDALMNRVFPEFSPVSLEHVLADGGKALPRDRAVRLHVTRWTEYGDRYKLFVIPPESMANGDSLNERLGISVEQEEGRGLLVNNLQFNGPAELAGLTFGDNIDEIDIAELDRPAKEWVYILGFLVLGVVILTQSMKSRRKLRHSDSSPDN